MSYIGARIPRREDTRLLTGLGRYVDDVSAARTLHAAILRSSMAHAPVERVDVTAARAMPGVVAVLTAADLPETLPPIPFRLVSETAAKTAVYCRQFPLARGRVRYVGEPLAVVVAESPYLAEDALELIEVDYGPSLDVVSSVEAGLAADAAVIHPELGHNRGAELRQKLGDVESAFAAADLVISERFETNRQASMPLETRGLMAEYDPGRGHLTVTGPTKVVHFNRSVLAQMLGMAESQIRFVEPDVGGGFGARGEFYPEDYLIPYLAVQLGAAVKWIENRHEHFLAINHSRQQTYRIDLALRRTGEILGLKCEILNDHGAYMRTHAALVAECSATSLTGPYRVPNFDIYMIDVMTNKTPTGTYRAPGFYEATYVRERMLDMAAHRLGLDPALIRQRNLIRAQDMPYDTGNRPNGFPVVYDGGDFPQLYQKALSALGYEQLRQEQAAARQAGRYIGIGTACFGEREVLPPWEYARVEVGTAGEVRVFAGCSNVGQSPATGLAQIVADQLSVSIEQVEVLHGDTNLVPYGRGSWGSRTTVMAGTAAHLAAAKVRSKMMELASRWFEVSPDDVECLDGRVQIKGVPGRRLSFAEVARRVQPGPSLPEGMEPGLTATHVHKFSHPEMNVGVHACAVEVEIDTAQVKILDYVIAFDVGRAINPMLIEGQLQGGVAQGVGGTLLEDLVYDQEGQLLTASFMDYLIPTAMEVPRVRLVLEETPSPSNPLGVRGCGEAGVTGVGGALANAISDALQPFGVEICRLPISQLRLFELLRGGVHT